MIADVLDGKYRIDKQLGAGGMGNVYLATHLWTTRLVAVKVIAPKWASEPQFLARFQREAQACGRLRHPNIVNVTDFGIAKTEGGDTPYLVMEYLDGQTLSDFQEANPRIPLPLAADLLDQIGLALDEAHRHRIVHRDLKPDNVWLEPNGRGGYIVKVLDFGVAKLNLLGEDVEERVIEQRTAPPPLSSDAMETVAVNVSEASRRADETETLALKLDSSTPSSGSLDSSGGAQTMPGSLLGTPAYMSPEQALGKEVDYRSDIYSLAVLAYSLACGRLPFKGTPTELFEYHLNGTPDAPARVSKMPKDVSDAILAGLARDPAKRPASAGEFARRFHNAVDAEFLALRRSKAFLLRHLGTFASLVIPGCAVLVTFVALLGRIGKTLIGPVRIVLVPLAAVAVLLFADNVLRASAAMIAAEERRRVRRFLAFRVFWRLLKLLPALVRTQVESTFYFGPGWLIGDCLWPVLCVVEGLSGRAAAERSRTLMTGLRSAGRALAIRHYALAALALAEAISSLSVLWRTGSIEQGNTAISSSWFPIFALYSAAPLFLYDRTVADDRGPLLQLDRSPEITITTRALSWSSMLWLALALIELLYTPAKIWLFGAR